MKNSSLNDPRLKKQGQLTVHRLFLCMLFIGLIFPGRVAAQRSISSSMNWETGIFSLSIEEERITRQYNRPESLYATEREIQKTAAGLLFDGLLDIQIDSSNSLGDLARREPGLLQTVDLLSSNATMTSFIADRELNSIQSRFELNVYPGLTRELIRHSSPFPMEEVLEWQPGSQYSGVVIYARRRLPIHGEEESAILKPALFPVIYDENMRLLVDRNRMKPEYVRSWGGAAYSGNFSENRARIGENPFRIIALGVFGITHTDPLIPVQDANILLHSESNRRLLQEGRILIIINNELD